MGRSIALPGHNTWGKYSAQISSRHLHFHYNNKRRVDKDAGGVEMAAIVRGNYLDPITVCRRACSQSPGLAIQPSGVDTVSEARLIWLLAICMKLESRGFLGVGGVGFLLYIGCRNRCCYSGAGNEVSLGCQCIKRALDHAARVETDRVEAICVPLRHKGSQPLWEDHEID